MSAILFSFLFLLFSFPMPIENLGLTEAVDVLPTFVGYLILWYVLEKRRFSKLFSVMYSVCAGMAAVTFFGFLAQIRGLFPSVLQGDGEFFGWILSKIAVLFGEYADGILLLNSLVIGLFFIALYRKNRENSKKQAAFSLIGAILCGANAVCYLGALAVILPFSWHAITYPVALLTFFVAYFAMKDDAEFCRGTR